MLFGNPRQMAGSGLDRDVLDAAVRFAVEAAARLEDGEHRLGDGMYATVKAYRPGPEADKRFESHVKYADLQCVLDGGEVILAAPAAGLAIVEDDLAAKDIRFHAEPAAELVSRFRLFPRDVLLLLPEDAHKPECFCGVATGRKAIVKIPVSLLMK